MCCACAAVFRRAGPWRRICWTWELPTSGGSTRWAGKFGHPEPVGAGQVEIEVHAAGLNFRDMMWAMGLLPEEALIDGFAGPTFGLECAGIVRSVGPGSTAWRSATG